MFFNTKPYKYLAVAYNFGLKKKNLKFFDTPEQAQGALDQQLAKLINSVKGTPGEFLDSELEVFIQTFNEGSAIEYFNTEADYIKMFDHLMLYDEDFASRNRPFLSSDNLRATCYVVQYFDMTGVEPRLYFKLPKLLDKKNKVHVFENVFAARKFIKTENGLR